MNWDPLNIFIFYSPSAHFSFLRNIVKNVSFRTRTKRDLYWIIRWWRVNVFIVIFFSLDTFSSKNDYRDTRVLCRIEIYSNPCTRAVLRIYSVRLFSRYSSQSLSVTDNHEKRPSFAGDFLLVYFVNKTFSNKLASKSYFLRCRYWKLSFITLSILYIR